MRRAQARVFLLAIALLYGALPPVASASTLQLVVAEDKTAGYNRSLFKHWIDADKDGCNTRAEVLIEEAIVKPKIGPKCKLTGGKWLSAYDGKTITNASQLDVDHLVPLAEAWRSGAWKWSAAERQAYANDLENSEALIAVTLTTNRGKGDKDPASWMPKENYCSYLKNWVAIKTKYLLTVDSKENSFIQGNWVVCNSGTNSKIPIPKTPEAIVESSTAESFAWVQINVTPYDYIPGKNTQMQGYIDESVYGPSVLECFYNSKSGQNKFVSTYPIFSNTASIFCKVKNNSAFIFYTEAQEIYINKLINPTKSEVITVKVGTSPAPAPAPTTQNLVVSPGAFCAPVGAIGKSTSGVTYTCKSSSTDSRNRWRQ
jgi:hypothetical protein